jgi:hypothetical protein
LLGTLDQYRPKWAIETRPGGELNSQESLDDRGLLKCSIGIVGTFMDDLTGPVDDKSSPALVPAVTERAMLCRARNARNSAG